MRWVLTAAAVILVVVGARFWMDGREADQVEARLREAQARPESTTETYEASQDRFEAVRLEVENELNAAKIRALDYARSRWPEADYAERVGITSSIVRLANDPDTPEDLRQAMLDFLREHDPSAGHR
jgi:hypothetical protein